MIKNKNLNHKPKLLIASTLLVILTASPVFSLTIEDTIQEFENTINLYDSNEISVAQLIVLLEEHMNENQRYLQENDIAGWDKNDIEYALRSYKTEYGYVIDTHDLHVFI